MHRINRESVTIEREKCIESNFQLCTQGKSYNEDHCDYLSIEKLAPYFNS